MSRSTSRFLFTILCVGLLVLSVEERGTGYDAADAVKECLRKTDCLQLDEHTRWTDFLEDKPPCLALHRMWWSPRKPTLPAVLITQLSADRVGQLGAQCAMWRGPLAAALHILLPPEMRELSDSALRTLSAAEQRINDVYEAAEAAGSCQLRVMLLYEVIGEPKASSLYPVNSLRNFARLMADTEMIANIDVDMIPSLSLSLSLMDESSGRVYLEGCNKGAVYVLPAFDVKCGGPAYADSICLRNKEGLVQVMDADCLTPFRYHAAPSSHSPTNFSRWLSAEGPYGIQYQELFEPWFLSARARTPWFDYRFRGYGKNKIMQAMHMNWTGSQFFVHSSAFIVHRPHNESRARKEFLRAKFGRFTATQRTPVNGSIFEHIGQLYDSAKLQLERREYDTGPEPGMKECLATLPWWKDITKIVLGSELGP